jgi:hypothetical protein
MAAYILVASVFVLGTGLVLGLILGVTKLPGYLAQRRLQSRLGELSIIDVPDSEDAGGLLKEKYQGPLPVLDRFASGTTRGLSLTRWIDQSGVRMSLSALFLASVRARSFSGSSLPRSRARRSAGSSAAASASSRRSCT